MLELSDAQLAAVYEAKKLLADVGLTTAPTNPDDHDSDDVDFLGVSRIIAESLPPSDSGFSCAIRGSHYKPPPARAFTAEEFRRGLDCINRQTSVSAIVNHPIDAIVEYPETGERKGVAIGHRFLVNPIPEKLYLPHENFQYSLGDSRGGETDVFCGILLQGRTGSPVSCEHKRRSCKGLKYCSARSVSTPAVAPLELNSLAAAKREVFFKTLAFYCTLAEKGCAFDIETDGEDIHARGFDTDSDSEDSSSESESGNEATLETGTKIIKDSRRKAGSKFACRGKLRLQLDENGRSFIQCQYRKKSDRAHLILRSLDEFDIPYLRALLENDTSIIHEREELARQFGYGPRTSCNFSASPSEQKQLCPYWHRSDSGSLARGRLERVAGNCPATFDIYIPHDLVDCPQIVVICRSPHSHSQPAPVKTPPPLLEIFKSLLLKLDWKLADATPRKLMLDSGFMTDFRRVLGWDKRFDPPLDALHPSFGNLDHVRRYIDELRHVLFPKGTGFEGAELLATQHRELPEMEQYVRCAETHRLDDGTTFYLVICMLRAMSALLMQSKTLSLDTAFKRLSGKWQEFEMERWDLSNMKSIIGTRAFTTSQSAEAHLILFTRIFEIASADTGIPCRFRHIHGEGFELWITDAHKGQALGAGMFCQKLCAQLREVCPLESPRLLQSLDPYDHLRRFLRLCTTHNKRNIDKLKPYTTRKVRNAMLSISSSEAHPDLEGAYKIIKSGGRKAKAWLKDKQSGSKFAIPALYQPASLIPLEIWKSAPSTTNGNEQAHRNINRDGVNLTMLGAIMRGMQYDARAMGALDLYSSQGIYSRDQTATHFRRLQRSLNRHLIVQTRVIAAANEKKDSVLPIPPHTESVPPDIEIGVEAPGLPLYTTAPLIPVHLEPESLPTASWYAEDWQMSDASENQGPNASSSSIAYNCEDGHLHPDNIQEFLDTYGFPSALFDPNVQYVAAEQPSYVDPLHIQQYSNLAPLPPFPSHYAFNNHNY